MGCSEQEQAVDCTLSGAFGEPLEGRAEGWHGLALAPRDRKKEASKGRAVMVTETRVVQIKGERNGRIPDVFRRWGHQDFLVQKWGDVRGRESRLTTGFGASATKKMELSLRKGKGPRGQRFGSDQELGQRGR